MQIWRLVKPKYAAAAFDGEGARLYGARWNSAGVRVAYASSDPALAVLEVLVHVKDTNLLSSYSLVSGSIPDGLVKDVDRSLLPKEWRSSPVPATVQAVGDDWIRSASSLALRVPSVLVPSGSNLLINPAHPDFARVTVESIEPYRFDSRLIR
jgi:RES domain-containing protein